jgi:hypothetical protein
MAQVEESLPCLLEALDLISITTKEGKNQLGEAG